jgi:hypothetical protein
VSQTNKTQQQQSQQYQPHKQSQQSHQQQQSYQSQQQRPRPGLGQLDIQSHGAPKGNTTNAGSGGNAGSAGKSGYAGHVGKGGSADNGSSNRRGSSTAPDSLAKHGGSSGMSTSLARLAQSRNGQGHVHGQGQVQGHGGQSNFERQNSAVMNALSTVKFNDKLPPSHGQGGNGSSAKGQALMTYGSSGGARVSHLKETRDSLFPGDSRDAKAPKDSGENWADTPVRGGPRGTRSGVSGVKGKPKVPKVHEVVDLIDDDDDGSEVGVQGGQGMQGLQGVQRTAGAGGAGGAAGAGGTVGAGAGAGDEQVDVIPVERLYFGRYCKEVRESTSAMHTGSDDAGAEAGEDAGAEAGAGADAGAEAGAEAGADADAEAGAEADAESDLAGPLLRVEGGKRRLVLRSMAKFSTSSSSSAFDEDVIMFEDVKKIM